MPADAQQQAQWYCRRSGAMFGPLSTDRLEELLRSQALADDDQVRLGTEAAWMPVSDVRRMFEESRGEAEDAGADAAHAAAAALSKSAKARLRRPTTARQGVHRPPPARPNPIAAAVGTLVELAATFVAAGLVQAARIFRLRIVQAGIVAVLAGLVVWKVVLPRIPIPSDVILAQYQQLWQDVQAAREQSAESADWDRLQRRIAATVAETKPHLTSRSSPEHAERHELVLAAELLSVVAREARVGEASTRNEGQLTNHLRFAERQLAEKPPPLLTRLNVLVFSGWAVVFAVVLLWMFPFKNR